MHGQVVHTGPTGPDGANAKTVKFDMTDHQTGETQNISVFDYFQRRYNVRLKYWQLPLIESSRGRLLFPWEVCHLNRYNRYPFKLDQIKQLP